MKLLPFERRWLAAVFDAMLPPGVDPRLELGARDLPLDRFADAFLSAVPLTTAVGLRAFLWLVVWSPPFAVRRLTWFPSLSREERLAHIERLASSDVYLIREAPLALKAIACMGYCGMPEVQRSMGIDPTDPTPPAWAGGSR